MSKEKLPRVILHSDLDNFYASVEILKRPDLKEKPVAVCGDGEQRHGVVLAENSIAKCAGVKTGDVFWQAKQKCPELIEVPACFSDYLRVSKAVRRIYERFTDRIEAFGIDECWLDISQTAAMFGGGRKIAETIRADIREEIGITASVGISWNKIFAKLGSELNKPDGQFEIGFENYKRTAWQQPADKLLYVGKVTAEKLRAVGVFTIGDLARADVAMLCGLLGKWGYYLHDFANGKDEAPVIRKEEERNVKSIGNSLTNYRDLETEEEAVLLIYLLSDSVASRLREGMFGKAECVKISVVDSSLNRYAKQGKLRRPSKLSTDIAQKAIALLRQVYPWHLPIRGIGVSVSEFTYGCEQMDIFADLQREERDEKLESALDAIRKKYGNNVIQRASILKDTRLRRLDIKEEHVIRPENYFGK